MRPHLVNNKSTSTVTGASVAAGYTLLQMGQGRLHFYHSHSDVPLDSRERKWETKDEVSRTDRQTDRHIDNQT